MNIQYVEGDATRPVGDGPKIIAHICNDIGGWGRGFVLAISKRWPTPEREFRRWHGSGVGFALGEVQLVEIESSLWVANMVGQRDIHPSGGVPPIRYEAVESCLTRLVELARPLGASIHMPRIGCGLAGGTWDRIEPLIQKIVVASRMEVIVYDLPTR